MKQSSKPVIFISYRSEDQLLANAFKKAIETDFLGFPRVFLASDLHQGAHWKGSLRGELANASVVCVLRSEKAETHWLAMEIGAAWVVSATIIAVCYGELTKGQLTDLPVDIQAVDARSHQDLDDLYQALARVLDCKAPLVSGELLEDIENFHKTYVPEAPEKKALDKQRQYVKAHAKGGSDTYQNIGGIVIKNLSEVTGTLVWTIPSRKKRPGVEQAKHKIIVFDKHKEKEDYCVFCEAKYHDASPEISRLCQDDGQIRGSLTADEIFSDKWAPAFRRIPNIFPILSNEYWAIRGSFAINDHWQQRYLEYIRTERGKEHVDHLVEYLRKQMGKPDGGGSYTSIEESLFRSSHDLIVASRHFSSDGINLGSGQLEHRQHYDYMRFTIEAARDIYACNRLVHYVVVFQNWLAPSGATLDHLHKQLVGIDEPGLPVQRYLEAIKQEPQFFSNLVERARKEDLVVAENDHAVAFVEMGRRYPVVAIHARQANYLWDYSAEAVRGMSDVVHACHVALGVETPTNEEWYYTPPGEEQVFPWHVLIVLRISIQAGFEHATRIYINSYAPHALKVDLVKGMQNRSKRLGNLEVSKAVEHGRGVGA